MKKLLAPLFAYCLIPPAIALSPSDMPKGLLTLEQYQQMLNESFPDEDGVTVEICQMGEVSYSDALHTIQELKKAEDGFQVIVSPMNSRVAVPYVMPRTYYFINTVSVVCNKGPFVIIPPQADFEVFISGTVDLQNETVINVSTFSVLQTYSANLEKCTFDKSYQLNYPYVGDVLYRISGTATFAYTEPNGTVLRYNYPITIMENFTASKFIG